MSSPDSYEVVVVGGGPAGSVMAWSLAKRGVRVAVLERATFPREKVCGDFVEPGGLRILETMGCRSAVEASSPLPITKVQIFIRSQVAYREKVPYYEEGHGLPTYGCVVPRHQLDTHLLECARAASATVLEDCLATDIRRDGRVFRIGVRSGGRRSSVRARLIVGADGTQSMVARSFGLLRNDRRYTSISQRGYVDAITVDGGEAALFFDDDWFPGYGWMFPMAEGRANIGAGILSEACQRNRLSIPETYSSFQQKLRERHPGCSQMRAVGKPLGGIVKTYGGAGPNHFDGGVLIGDAGCFVDPMTGEGITPAMESALIASRTVAAAIEQGRSDAAFLSRFERDFRQYFDPAMCFLDLCATLMRNRHFREFWLSSAKRIFLQATESQDFARVAGSTFGGVGVQPLPILGQALFATLAYIGEGNAEMGLQLLGARANGRGSWMGDLAKWQSGLWSSLLDDPFWHFAWTSDLLRKWARVQSTLWSAGNPRVRGPLPDSRVKGEIT